MGSKRQFKIINVYILLRDVSRRQKFAVIYLSTSIEILGKVITTMCSLIDKQIDIKH